MAKCNQLTHLPFKGLMPDNFKPCISTSLPQLVEILEKYKNSYEGHMCKSWEYGDSSHRTSSGGH